MGETAGELRLRIEDQRATLGQDLDALGDRMSPRRMAERRKAAVRSRFRGVRDSVMGTASEVRDSVQQAGGSVQEAVQGAPEAAREQIQGAPLAAGLLAFAAGLVVSALVPETESEQHLAQRIQPQMEQVASEVGSAAQDAAQSLKPVAQDAAQHVKQQAQQSAQSVKDDAAHAGHTVADQAQTR